MQPTLLHLEHAKATALARTESPARRERPSAPRHRAAALLIHLAWRLDRDALPLYQLAERR